MGKIVKLKNKKTGVRVYPVTATSAVVDADSGERLNDTLQNKVEEAPMDGNQYVRINGTWGVAQMATSTKEKCIITLASNQGESDAASIYGATVKVTDVDSAEVYHEGVWDGTEIALEFTPGVNYKVEVGDVADYATPESKTLTALDFNVRNLVMTYNTEIVSVTLSADNGASVIGQQVTINGVTKTFDGTNAVVQKVAYGTAYTISVSEKEDYIKPSDANFQASQIFRNLEFEYKHRLGTTSPSVGVYIQDTDGYCLTIEEWEKGNPASANGIAVITDDCSFVVALQDVSYAGFLYGGNDVIIDGVFTANDLSSAVTDFNGEQNYEALIDYLGTTANSAPQQCYLYTFPDNSKGYLGAAGEWKLFHDNYEAIKTALNECGGTLLQDEHSDYYATSTQKSETGMWAMSINYGISSRSKTEGLLVRAFKKL